jgi:ketosteroid isomerase-like protein
MARPKSSTAALMASPQDIEAEFYEALQRGDIERLMAVWSDDDEVVCVHPGGPRIIGVAAVRATFEALFAEGPVNVRPEQVRRVQGPGCVVHNLLERVEVLTAEGPLTAWVVVTNVYVKGTQGWRMVAHHASGGSSEEPPEISEAPPVLH